MPLRTPQLSSEHSKSFQTKGTAPKVRAWPGIGATNYSLPTCHTASSLWQKAELGVTSPSQHTVGPPPKSVVGMDSFSMCEVGVAPGNHRGTSMRGPPHPSWASYRPCLLPPSHRQTWGPQAGSSWHRRTGRPPQCGGKSDPSAQVFPHSPGRNCTLMEQRWDTPAVPGPLGHPSSAKTVGCSRVGSHLPESLCLARLEKGNVE